MSDNTLSWGTDSSSGNLWDELDKTFAKSRQQRETESKKRAGSDVHMQPTRWPLHRSKGSDYLLVCWCSLLDGNNKYIKTERQGEGEGERAGFI